MLVAIAIFLYFLRFVFASPLHDSSSTSITSSDEKRSLHLDCNSNTQVPASPDPRVNQFRTIGELCGAYPNGLGFFCNNNGLDQRRPYTDLQRIYGAEIGEVCLAHCRCAEIAPDEPTVQEALHAQFMECALSDDEPEEPPVPEPTRQPPRSSSCPNLDEVNAERYQASINCDSYWYGHPTSVDCRQALRVLPDAHLNQHNNRQFLASGVQPLASGSTGAPVRTPFMATHGTCTIAVLIPEGPGTVNDIVVDTLRMNAAARRLRETCVVGLGVGGNFHQDDEWREEDVHELPEIVMYGPNSKMEEFLGLKYACITDSKGGAKCKSLDIEQPSGQTSQGALGSVSSGQSPAPQGSKLDCSGSCLDSNDCNLNSNCVCASDKGIPLSSSWGQHACTYVAGAAVAMAAAAIAPNACRGRCFLEEDGTLGIDSPAGAPNGSDAVASYDASDIFANMTTPVATNVTDQNIANSSDLLSPSSNAAPPSTFNSSGLSLNASSIPQEDDDTFGNASSVIDSSSHGTSPDPKPGQDIPDDVDQPDPILYCPCNCTYVSTACCLSKLVWEDPSLQISMDPLPANSSVCCDTENGKWQSKSSGCGSSASNDSDAGIKGLGSVEWNPNAPAPNPPGDEDGGA